MPLPKLALAKAIQHYDVKLPTKNIPKPTSFKKAGNSEHPQWFQAKLKEKDGMLNFQTWQRLDQSKITPAIRTSYQGFAMPSPLRHQTRPICKE
jgi:hypothetical protein